jgi:alpha,alpha-trehalase
LKNYGYIQEADRIALKWLNLNHKVWRQTKQLFEKYDVVRGTHEIEPDRRYTNQSGFGWTNAVFHLLVADLLSRLD